MSKLTPILTLHQSAEVVIPWMIDRLQLHGFQVQRTFDLQAARFAQQGGGSPQHGARDCTCQMVILVVQSQTQLTTVVAHGQDDYTYLSMGYGASPRIDEKVLQALLPAVGSLDHRAQAESGIDECQDETRSGGDIR